MVTRLEQFLVTRDGIDHGVSTTLQEDESVFFPNAVIDEQECCVQVTDQDDETLIEIYREPEKEPDEVVIRQFDTFDIPLGESSDTGPTMMIRVSNTVFPVATEVFSYN